jgi:hypothetical protein
VENCRTPVKAGHFFLVDKNAYYVTNDTVFVVPDTVQCFQKRHSLEGTNKFYNSLIDKLSKKNYANLLYKLVFEKEEEKKALSQEQESKDFEHSRLSYLPHEGKQINDIQLKDLKVFGTDVEDTSKLETSVITNMLNSLHLYTREGINKYPRSKLTGYSTEFYFDEKPAVFQTFPQFTPMQASENSFD